MILPSKELLSAVLGNYDFDDLTIIGNELRYHRGHYGINIYELAHKCKERAYNKGYKLASYKSDNNWICRVTFNSDKPYLGADTEPEAIFKACEWVLKETK